MYSPPIRMQDGHLVTHGVGLFFSGRKIGEGVTYPICAISLDDAWVSYCWEKARHLMPPIDQLSEFWKRRVRSAA